MAAGRAALPDAHHSPGQRDVVANDDHVGRLALGAAYQFPHRQAAQIHHRLRLGQHHFVPGDLAQAHERFRFRPRDANVGVLGQRVHDQKAQVVRRPGIFDAGIAEAHDQAHAIHRDLRSEPPVAKAFLISAASWHG